MKNTPKKFDKELVLYIILAGFFLVNAMLAEVIGAKIFSLEKLFGISPLNIPFIGGEVFTLNLSVGILIWPFVFITTDIVNEYFGKSGVRRLSILGAILIAYGFIIIFGGTELPPSDYWLQVNGFDKSGQPFDINYAYSTIFRQGMGIIVGSIIAFLVGQLVDLYVFHFIRSKTGHKKLWLRANGSNLVSQFVDSFLILLIAFYWLGNWSFSKVIALGLAQYIYKVGMAAALTPVIYWVHSAIDKYLGREHSEEMIDKAEEGLERT
ncbi:MAG TPA: queuosine precursor transporter [Bacteroidales bacterium]|nr:queuosine precursor transporter [Bacteroidales bacterium]